MNVAILSVLGFVLFCFVCYLYLRALLLVVRKREHAARTLLLVFVFINHSHELVKVEGTTV